MSEVKVDKISPKTGTSMTVGDSGDTFTVPSGATLAVAGALNVTGSITATDKIDSAHYAAGSIDLEHMSANSIDSDQYVDGSIDTAHIADDQVTLAKMAGLARGKIIYGDSSGNPAALAVGSANQVLTADGTDVAWAAASGGDNTPSFGAKLTSNQTYSASTWTKAALATELWDTDSAFDPSTNYRFTVPSGEGGKYVFHYGTELGGLTLVSVHMYLYVNGSNAVKGNIRYYVPNLSGYGIYITASTVLNLSASDYVELYLYSGASSATTWGHTRTMLYGHKLAGV